MSALLAERRAALRSIDIEALEARAAALGNRPAPAPWAASLAAGNAAALARMSSPDAAAKQLQPKAERAAAAAEPAAAPPRRPAGPNATPVTRGAAAEQLQPASLGTRNAAALARISRHDAPAAQLQCQLAAEAAAVVRAGALRSIKNNKKEKSGLTAATSVEFPPVAGENPFAQAVEAAVAWVAGSAPQRSASGQVSVMGFMPSLMLPALAGDDPFAQAAAAIAVSSVLERTASEEEMSRAGSMSSATLPALAVANPFAQTALPPPTEEDMVLQPPAVQPLAPPVVAPTPTVAEVAEKDALVTQAAAEATAVNRAKDQALHSKLQPRRRSQPSRSRPSLAVVKENDAGQPWQQALEDDSAEFYAPKPAKDQPPLVRMDSAVPVYHATVDAPPPPADGQDDLKHAPVRRSKAVEMPRVVGEQPEQNALDDDSAEFYMAKPAQQPLARMASSLAFEFPTLIRPEPTPAAAAAAQPEKPSKTMKRPTAEIKPAPVKSIKAAEVLLKSKEEVPATPRGAPEKGNAPKEEGIKIAVPATPVKKSVAAAAWEPATPGHGIEPPPAAIKPEREFYIKKVSFLSKKRGCQHVACVHSYPLKLFALLFTCTVA